MREIFAVEVKLVIPLLPISWLIPLLSVIVR